MSSLVATSAAGAVVDEYAVRRPVLDLRSAVGAYHGYRQRGLAPALHRGLPSPFVTLIFTLDDRLHIARHSDPAQAPGRYETLAGGLHTSPVLIEHDGAQSGLQVSISPLWARRLFGLPAGELANIDLDGDDLLGPTAVRLQDRLRSAPSWPARFALLDETFTGLLRNDPAGEVPAEVVHVWRRLHRAGGAVPIADLVGETGWSDRHLSNRFRRETGLTPKAAARVVRFHTTRRHLERGLRSADPRSPIDTPLADVAVAHGYYDQSHLVREFRALSGCAPTQWLAAEYGDGQER